MQITIPTRLSHVIGPYSYWNMQFYQGEGAYVNWELSVPRGASIGFYARRNALPSHTHYDFMEILRGFKTRTTRSSPVISIIIIITPKLICIHSLIVLSLAFRVQRTDKFPGCWSLVPQPV